MKKILLLFCFQIVFSFGGICQNFNVSNSVSWTKYSDRGRVGIKDTQNGDIIIPAMYKKIDYNSDKKVFLVQNTRGKYGYFSENGQVCVPCKYQIIRACGQSNVVNCIADNLERHVYDLSGKLMMSKKDSVDAVTYVEPGYFLVSFLNKTWGLYDKSFRAVIPNKNYTRAGYVYDSSNNVYFQFGYIGGKNSWFDSKGNKLFDTEAIITNIQQDSNGNYFYIHGSVPGRIEMDGTTTKHAIYGESRLQTIYLGGSKGAIAYIKDNKYGVKDIEGNLILPYEYDNLQLVEPNFLRIYKGNKIGLCDKDLKIIVPADKYVNTYISGKWIHFNPSLNKGGIMDLSGNIIVSHIYGQADGIMKTKNHNYVTIMNNEGKYAIFKIENTKDGQCTPITPFAYSYIRYFDKNGFFFPADEMGYRGIVDETGKVIVAPQYPEITYVEKYNYFETKDGNLCGIISPDGKHILEPLEFTSVSYNPSTQQYTAKNDERSIVLSKNGIIIEDSRDDKEFDKYVQLADEEFSKDNFLLAKEYYAKANELKRRAGLYYNQGICYFNLDKYSDAIKYFNLCLDNHPSEKLRNDAYDLIDESNDYILERRQQKIQKALNILGFVVGAAVTINNSRYIQNNAQYSLSESNNSSNDYDNDFVESSSGISTSTPRQKNKCGLCQGKGYTIEYSANYTGKPTKKYCNECGKSVDSTHYHRTCTLCHGKGVN